MRLFFRWWQMNNFLQYIYIVYRSVKKIGDKTLLILINTHWSLLFISDKYIYIYIEWSAYRRGHGKAKSWLHVKLAIGSTTLWRSGDRNKSFCLQCTTYQDRRKEHTFLPILFSNRSHQQPRTHPNIIYYGNTNPELKCQGVEHRQSGITYFSTVRLYVYRRLNTL